MGRATPILEESFRIPAAARDLEGFRAWARSDRFPQRGRIDYLAGDIEVDMSPEDLYTHGTVKVEITSLLHRLITKRGLGVVFSDRARISSPGAELSVEPDVVVLLLDTLRSGRVRQIAAAGHRPGRYVELEGAPDLVVEILSDSSVGKDLRRLPSLYAAAGVPELWLTDARGKGLRFEIQVLEGGGYKKTDRNPRGGTYSPFLRLWLRLRRTRVEPDLWLYHLETRKG